MPDIVCATTKRVLNEAGAFDVVVLEPERPTHVGLFAVGRGGDPSSHLPLLRTVAGQGCTIIAPYFEMLASAIPTKAELDLRIRRLEASADAYAPNGSTIFGIGHSIGAVMMLALAGGQGETRAGQQLTAGSKWKFSRLALLAPPADFFRRPGALCALQVSTWIWAGRKDTITPAGQAEFLKAALEAYGPVEVSIDDEAGHFTFMDQPPPQAQEGHPNRGMFLTNLATEVAQFIIR